MVRDTDGSAFITKAEFDSLKNNFQAQIDTYNSNIDSKIDSAIASYLSGIKIARTVNLVNNIEKLNTVYNVQWDNSSTGYQTTKPGYEWVFEAFIFYEIYDAADRKIVQKNCAWNKKTMTLVGPLSMPICNKTSSGKITINNYETRQTNWNVIGTWDYPFHSAITDTTADLSFSTSGNIQVLRDVNPCKNINVVNPPQVWAAAVDTSNRSVTDSACTMVVTGSCSISTTAVDDNLILMNTNSSASTYYFNLDNNTKSSYHGGDASTYVSFDNANWQEPPGETKQGTTNAITGPATLRGTPTLSTTDCPWDQTAAVSQDMYDSRIVSITGKDKPIKNGICMFEVDSKGKLTFDVTPEKVGSVRIYAFKQSAPSTFLVDETFNFTTTTKRSYTYDIDDSFNPSATDKVEYWVIFKPNSGKSKLTVEKTILTKEN